MNRKRKQKYVDTHVQGALLRRILMHWVVFFSVAVLTLALMMALVGDPGLEMSKRITSQSGQFILLGSVMLALLPVFMLDTTRFSNRFVGPIGRLRRHLRELGADQNTEPCSFRDNDFWSGMADEFNTVADLVKKQQQEIDRLKSQLTQSGITTRG